MGLFLKETEIENAVFILESSLNTLVETMVGNTGGKRTHIPSTPPNAGQRTYSLRQCNTGVALAMVGK